MTPDLASVALQLTLDLATRDVVSALRAEGIRCILIKGPAVAARLYDDPHERPYRDIDLYVEGAQFARAQEVLRTLGFVGEPEDAERPMYSVTWTRFGSAPAQVDLHRWFFWCADDPAQCWEELSRGTRLLTVGGVEVEALSDAAQILVLGAHAVQHRDAARPREDLARAIARLDRQAWRDASELAQRLGAAAALARGLALVADGEELAAELELSLDAPPNVQLVIDGAPPAAFSLLSFSHQRGTRARLQFVARKLLPHPAVLRTWLKTTAHPSLPTGLGYPYRWVWLLRRAPRAVLALARALRRDPGATR